MSETVIHYTIRGAIVLPEGARLNDAGTGILLADGKMLKVWEQFELHDAEDEDDTRNLTYDEVTALGVFYDGDTAEYEEAELHPSGQLWPPK